MRKDKEGKDVTNFLMCLVNTAQINAAVPSEIGGLIEVTMADGKVFLLKDSLKHLREEDQKK